MGLASILYVYQCAKPALWLKLVTDRSQQDLRLLKLFSVVCCSLTRIPPPLTVTCGVGQRVWKLLQGASPPLQCILHSISYSAMTIVLPPSSLFSLLLFLSLPLLSLPPSLSLPLLSPLTRISTPTSVQYVVLQFPVSHLLPSTPCSFLSASGSFLPGTDPFTQQVLPAWLVWAGTIHKPWSKALQKAEWLLWIFSCRSSSWPRCFFPLKSLRFPPHDHVIINVFTYEIYLWLVTLPPHLAAHTVLHTFLPWRLHMVTLLSLARLTALDWDPHLCLLGLMWSPTTSELHPRTLLSTSTDLVPTNQSFMIYLNRCLVWSVPFLWILKSTSYFTKCIHNVLGSACALHLLVRPSVAFLPCFT